LVATIKMLFISAQVRRLVVIHIYQGKTDPLEAAKKQRKNIPQEVLLREVVVWTRFLLL